MFRITVRPAKPPRDWEETMLLGSGDLAPTFGENGAKAIADAVARTLPYPYETKVQVVVGGSTRFPQWDGMVLTLLVEPWSGR